MHTFKIADVEADGFDFSLLKIPESEVADIAARFAEVKSAAEEAAKKINPNYYYVSSDTIVRILNLNSEALTLSYLFQY